MKDIYPLTIIADRYTGAYSKGRYLAFQLKARDIPLEVDGDEDAQGKFWKEAGASGLVVGKGDSPAEAFEDLLRYTGKATAIMGMMSKMKMKKRRDS